MNASHPCETAELESLPPTPSAFVCGGGVGRGQGSWGVEEGGAGRGGEEGRGAGGGRKRRGTCPVLFVPLVCFVPCFCFVCDLCPFCFPSFFVWWLWPFFSFFSVHPRPSPLTALLCFCCATPSPSLTNASLLLPPYETLVTDAAGRLVTTPGTFRTGLDPAEAGIRSTLRWITYRW